MAKLTTHQTRERYLAFFEKQRHVRVPSASLLPENDPTTLFTGSGMQPMLPYLLGQTHPQGNRLVDSQKCFRAEDIEEIGDNRHTTFFEMLGNWSLGDYFKREQLTWMFEFLTQELGLDPQRLYVTVFAGQPDLDIPADEESVKIWQDLFAKAGIQATAIQEAETKGLQDGRIFYYGEKKNWWSRAGVTSNMPVGEPGGPDSEMFWDFGESLHLHEQSAWKDQPCHVNCDCGRFMEIGNNVFMQYIKTADGFKTLPQKNVDFGGGLERLQAAINDNPDVFTIDLFAKSREVLERLSNRTYGQNAEDTKAFRIIMDHLRAATFFIGDGIMPATKDQGYFTRRLIRRAVRYAHHLGIPENFCREVAVAVIETYKDVYPDLDIKRDNILAALDDEEVKFRKTLATGLRLFEQIASKLQSGATVSADQAFDLYQSYGFPLEMTLELAQEKGLTVDEAGFQDLFTKHQELSRTGSEQKFKGGLGGDTPIHRQYHTATHLLHQALRTVLGNHVEQRGSNITAERLRFDFSHPQKMTDEEKKAVEDLVNEQIKADLPVTRREMTVPEAKELGALGLFEHKYGDTVSVYTMGDFSKEICGGPHVEHTGELGHFKITKEEAASAGIRRIKAIFDQP